MISACVVIVLLGFGTILSTSAQNYYRVNVEGVTDEFNPLADGNELLGGSIGSFNDQMSAAVMIPFPFNFYGQPVTQYRASDNGYITFDVTNTTSNAINGTLPDPSAPLNAIFAYWEDFELNTAGGMGTVDAMVNYTVGDPGNRVHVIQWRSVSRVGLPADMNYFYFAIRLYENNAWDFDIVHQWIRPQAPALITATIGCQDATGANGTMVPGSPNIDLPLDRPALEDLTVHAFIYGTQPMNDIYIKDVSLPRLVNLGTTYDLLGTVFNHGTAAVNSFAIDYRVDGGALQSFTFTPQLPLQPNEKSTFIHTTKYDPQNVGNFEDVEVWISAINGGVDANPDSASTRPFVNLGTRASKKVLFEEFSTAPCGFCPDAKIFINDLRTAYLDQVIIAQHHAGFGTDDMTIGPHSTYAAAFALGAPSAMINRIHYPGEDFVTISRYGPNSTRRWIPEVGDALGSPSPVNVGVETFYNSTSGQLDIEASVEFVDYAVPGDLRITVFVKESEVTGTGNGYDQRNYYSAQGQAAGGPSHPYYSQPDPIPGYVHEDVVRAVLTADWGDPLNLAATPSSSNTYNYSYFVPSTFNWENLSVIAFVSYYDDNERLREVLNANFQPLIERGVGIENALVAEGFKASVFPNPVTGVANIGLELGEQANLRIDVLDMVGKQVGSVSNDLYTAGNHQLSFDASQLSSGVYFVRFTSEKGVATHKFIVAE